MSACLAAAAVVTLAGCAAGPPLRLYTLSKASVSPIEPPLEGAAPVIEIERVSLPSYIDTQDIVTREGDVVVRSMTGRWVSRLSLLASDFLTDRLARAIPRAVVTDQRQPATPDYRITLAISDLDVTRAGTATLSADWEIVSREAGRRVIRKRIRFTLDGSAATDQDVVRLERTLFDRLADSIISSLSVIRTTPVACSQDAS
jgi:cholesterol transport system auxiliary component